MIKFTIRKCQEIKMSSGFSLTELLVVIGLFVILAALAVPVYGQWQAAAQIDSGFEEIINAVRLARIKAMSGLNNSAHGVYFQFYENGGGVINVYQGKSYTERNAEYDLRFEIDSSLVGKLTLPTKDINFSQGLGFPSATGTIMLSHNNRQQNKTLSINDLGVINIAAD